MSRFGTQQRDMFYDLFKSEKHECLMCKKNIDAVNNNDMMTYTFAHILPKKMFVKYRHDPRNIVLVCSIECHNKLDKGLQNYWSDIYILLGLNTTRQEIQEYIKKLLFPNSIWG